MRHITTLIGGLFIVGSLVACGDDNDTASTMEAPASTTEAPAMTEAPATTDPADWSATCGEYEGVDAEDTAQVEEMCATAAAFAEAINTYDTDALLAVTTEDFTYQTTGEPFTRDEFIPYFEENYEAGNFNVAPTDPGVMEVVGFATYEVVEPGEVTSEDYNATGTSKYTVTGGPDGWLISKFVWVEG